METLKMNKITEQEIDFILNNFEAFKQHCKNNGKNFEDLSDEMQYIIIKKIGFHDDFLPSEENLKKPLSQNLMNKLILNVFDDVNEAYPKQVESYLKTLTSDDILSLVFENKIKNEHHQNQTHNEFVEIVAKAIHYFDNKNLKNIIKETPNKEQINDITTIFHAVFLRLSEDKTISGFLTKEFCEAILKKEIVYFEDLIEHNLLGKIQDNEIKRQIIDYVFPSSSGYEYEDKIRIIDVFKKQKGFLSKENIEEIVLQFTYGLEKFNYKDVSAETLLNIVQVHQSEGLFNIITSGFASENKEFQDKYLLPLLQARLKTNHFFKESFDYFISDYEENEEGNKVRNFNLSNFGLKNEVIDNLMLLEPILIQYRFSKKEEQDPKIIKKYLIDLYKKTYPIIDIKDLNNENFEFNIGENDNILSYLFYTRKMLPETMGLGKDLTIEFIKRTMLDCKERYIYKEIQTLKQLKKHILYKNKEMFCQIFTVKDFGNKDVIKFLEENFGDKFENIEEFIKKPNVDLKEKVKNSLEEKIDIKVSQKMEKIFSKIF